jgi:hypothetical protein
LAGERGTTPANSGEPVVLRAGQAAGLDQMLT